MAHRIPSFGPRHLAAASVGITAAFDFLFYRHPIGWTVGAFTAALIGLAYWRFEGLRQSGRARWLGLAGLPLVAGLINEPTRLLILLAAVHLLSLAIVGVYGWSGSGTRWLARWARFLGPGPLRSLRDLAIFARAVRPPGDAPPAARRAAGTWMLPLAMTAIFVALFSIANPIVEDVTLATWSGVVDVLETLILTPRLFLWIFVGAVAWSWLVPQLERRPGLGESPRGGAGFTAVLRQSGPVLRTLVCCNVLFAIQTSLDMVYLLGGAALPEGMTYAEYAHRGAYPLVVAALIAALFILGVFREDGTVGRLPIARRLVSVWLLQTLLLTLSAAWRLDLYVESYQLTRWRFAAAVWMLLVFVGLLAIGARILLDRRNTWLVNVNLLTALLVLTAVGTFDVDGFIAGYNVEHAREIRGSGTAIDLGYLEGLGPAALPALARLAALDSTTGADAALAFDRALERLQAGPMSEWRGWTVRRQRLKNAWAEPLRGNARRGSSRIMSVARTEPGPAPLREGRR